MASILVVDDDDNVRQLLAAYLQAEGYSVEMAADGREAVRQAERGTFDLVILDVMLPGLDGLEAAGRIKAGRDVPILMLTARGAEDDVLSGFEAGADDYLSKPFSPKILVARVAALLRRTGGAEGGPPDRMVVGGLTIDIMGRTVQVDGRPVDLTATEFDLLVTLARHPGWVYSREQLLEEVWGYEYLGESRLVDVHMANLRRKLGDSPSDPQYIRTVRGVGYKLGPMEETSE